MYGVIASSRKITVSGSAPSITSQPSNATVDDTNQDTSGSSSPSYSNSTAVFPNPERGFYREVSAHSDSYTVLDSADLEDYRNDDDMSLVLRIFNLEDFFTSNISSGYLTNMQTDFDEIRNAGFKCIVRFAYNSDSPDPGNNNATKAWILTHIGQVAPILTANQDVIICVQAGFIGTWGEWYYTDYFGDEDTVTSGEYADRAEIVNAMLTAYPSTMQVAVRTPDIRERITGTTAGITLGEAFTNTTKARLAYHNDAFLSDTTDEGTYTSGQIATEKALIANDGQYVFVGGETDNDNTTFAGSANALIAMAALKFSYINIDYKEEVVARWRNGYTDPDTFEVVPPVMDEMKRNLGYRFRMSSATLPTTVKNRLPINITLVNDGYTNPHLQRNVKVVLKNTSTLVEHTFTLTTDIRLWASSQNITQDLDVSALAVGNYNMYLYMPDSNASIEDDVNYAIRLANTGTWDAFTGYNSLNHTVAIAARDTVQAVLSVTASGSITSYAWEENKGSGFVTISNGTSAGVTYSGATTATLTVTNPVTGWTYRAKVTGPGGTTTSNTVTITVT